MSSIKLATPSGGSCVLAPTNTASDRTITVPAVDATMAVVDGSGNLSVTGNLSFNSGYGSSAVAYGCRAWVNFNGTGTVAIRASGNVSSITDNGTGNYTVNFTNAMADANYAVTSINASVDPAGGIVAVSQSSSVTQTTSAFKLIYQNYAGTVFDIPYCVAAIFR